MQSDPRLDPRLVKDVSDAEGNKLEAYLDTEGNWTIGRGHLLPQAAPGKSWQGFTISQDVSDRYFVEDLLSALRYAQKLPEWSKLDTECRQNAITELCFNLRGRWSGFVKTRDAIQHGDWQHVHDELLNSKWATQVQPDGLDKPGRATRLADYLLDGEYP